MSQPFDFDKALKALQSSQALTGKDGILAPLIKQLTEAALAAELDSHLAADVEANRKNGFGKKTIKATTGSFELATPRDRNGTFEPQLVKKHQTTLSDEIEQKIIRLFAHGMSYADISGKSKIYMLSASLPRRLAPLLTRLSLNSGNSSSAHRSRFTLLSGWMPFTIRSARKAAMSARLSTPCWR